MTVATQWRKLGQLVAPDPAAHWRVSHVMLPVPGPPAAGDRTIYVTGRDVEGRGHIGRLSWTPGDGDDAGEAAVERTPLLSPGPLGAFDDSGVSASALVEADGAQYLYFTGWTRGVTVPFYVFVGLAVSVDGGRSFQRVSAAPILERNAVDPYLTGHPAVMREGGRWRMWYASGTGWDRIAGDVRHYYHIRYAESADGVVWRREGAVAIDYASADEYAIARPWVVKGDDGVYRMWFSRRGDAYRLGYAESSDGLRWSRDDSLAGIDVSDSGWDAEMVAYPCVFEHAGRQWMFYNGNGYGRTGVGVAARRLPAD